MNANRQPNGPADYTPGFSLVDIYFVVFRHKWLIAIFTLAGILAGAGYFFFRPPPFQSSAKIYIKYVSDTRPVNPAERGAQAMATYDLNQNLLNSEMQILTSFDVYESVAKTVGPEKILAKIGGGSDPLAAASIVSEGVKIEPSRESSVISITFRHPDQSVVRIVLSALIEDYLAKHLEVHNPLGLSADILMEKTSELRQQIAQTETELRMAKTNAGIVDVAAAEKSYSEEISRIRRELFQSEAALAEYQAGISETVSARAAQKIASGATNATELKITDDIITLHRALSTRLAFLEKRQGEYLAQGFTEENKLFKEAQGQIAEVAEKKSALESKYPGVETLSLAKMTALTGNANTPSGTASLASLPIRIKTLRSQLAQIQSEAAKLGETEAKISELLNKKKIQDGFLENIAANLQSQNIAQSLGRDWSSSNIKDIQKPTPPFRDFKKFYKNIGTLMMSGLLLGLGLAFLYELFLDRTIKRPIEIQTKLKIPFFLSIPDLNQSARPAQAPAARKQIANGQPASAGGAMVVRESNLEIMSWEVNHRLNSYYDALRDRLVVYFESINLTRKPKLVAVTSTHKGAGVSTIAAGLASSLSETGDGRVLLVDMNLENGAAQQFFRGRPNCKLDDALQSETRDGAMVQENLYVVTEDTVTDRLPRALPKRFASLIPKLKASDYDYIIFDMPPVSPTSVTARLSGFMDTVMLVIESEKTDQQVVQQANALLAQSKANVTAVLNKTKTYIPAKLHQDFLSDA